jgi:hypothetical protein
MVKSRKYFGTKKKSDLSEIEKEAIKDHKRRFSFWHSKQIDSLTFSINLLFTIAIALGGFIISNQEQELFKDKLFCGSYSLTRTTLFVLAISASIGVMALIARLNDLRLTKNKIRVRQRIFELENDIKYEDYVASDSQTQKLKRDRLVWWTTFLGKTTWLLFYIQVFLIIFTIWTLVSAI